MAKLGHFRGRRSLVRWTFWLAALVALFYLCDYLIEARMRYRMAPRCEWDTVPNPNNVAYDRRYSARICYLTKGWFLLRVYRGPDQLVAERTYPYPDLPNFYWKTNGLGYIHNDGGGFVEIPPTFIDRLLAKWP